MKKTKGSAAFYSDLEFIEKLRTYASYNKIPFSDIVNQALVKWLEEHQEEFDEAIKLSEEIESLIKSYKKI